MIENSIKLKKHGRCDTTSRQIALFEIAFLDENNRPNRPY